MATFKQLQDRVANRVEDLPAVTAAEIPLYINKAIRDAQERHNFCIMEATHTFVTTTGDHMLGTIPNFKEVRVRPWLEYGDGGNKPLQFAASYDEIVNNFSITDPVAAGMPEVVLQASVDANNTATFEVYPFPDERSFFSDGRWRIHVPYWRYLPDLVNATDTNWFTNNAAEYVFLQAVALAFESNFDEARADRYFLRAAAEFQKLQKIDKRSRLPRSFVLVPFRDVHASVTQSRM